MADKLKKRARALAAERGMSYQAAYNALVAGKPYIASAVGADGVHRELPVSEAEMVTLLEAGASWAEGEPMPPGVDAQKRAAAIGKGKRTGQLGDA